MHAPKCAILALNYQIHLQQKNHTLNTKYIPQTRNTHRRISNTLSQIPNTHPQNTKQTPPIWAKKKIDTQKIDTQKIYSIPNTKYRKPITKITPPNTKYLPPNSKYTLPFPNTWLMVLRSGNHRFERLIMVVHHWASGGMVTFHRQLLFYALYSL